MHIHVKLLAATLTVTHVCPTVIHHSNPPPLIVAVETRTRAVRSRPTPSPDLHASAAAPDSTILDAPPAHITLLEQTAQENEAYVGRKYFNAAHLRWADGRECVLRRWGCAEVAWGGGRRVVWVWALYADSSGAPAMDAMSFVRLRDVETVDVVDPSVLCLARGMREGVPVSDVRGVCRVEGGERVGVDPARWMGEEGPTYVCKGRWEGGAGGVVRGGAEGAR